MNAVASPGPRTIEPSLTDSTGSGVRPDPQLDSNAADTNSAESEHGTAYKITLSDEASAALAAGSIQAASTEPVPILPEVVVVSIQAKVASLESYLRSQQPPGVPDCGAIAREVNRYHMEQNGLAYQGVAWANQHVVVDPAVNLNDPTTKEQVKQVKDQVAAMAYEGLSNPGKLVNGPGSNDISAGSLMSTLANTTINIRAGLGPGGNADAGGTTTYNPNGTTTIIQLPGAVFLPELTPRSPHRLPP